MKIVVISNLYPPNTRGGAEVIVKTIVSGLRKRKHEVDVITTQPWQGLKSWWGTTEEQVGGKVYRFTPFNVFYYLNDYKHSFVVRLLWHALDMVNFHAFLMVLWILIKTKPDIVLTHNMKGLGLPAMLALRLYRVKVIHTIHDVQLLTPSGLFIKDDETNWQHTSRWNKWYQTINKWFFKGVTHVIAPSQYILDQHANFFAGKPQQVLVNPINIPHVVRYVKEGKWTDLQFLFVGQIETHKGIEWLIPAFLNYLQANNYLNYKLNIVGDGSLLESLRTKYTDKHVIWHGRLNRDELSKLFPTMDWLVFPSLCYENCPTVILESFSYDVPVIACDIGGAPELVKEGVNGFIFKTGDITDFHRVLEHLKTILPEVDKMKQNAYNAIKDKTPDKYCENLEYIIKQYIN